MQETAVWPNDALVGFAYPPAGYMTASMAAGHTRARLFADDAAYPSIWIAHEQYTVFMGGSGTPREMRDACCELARLVLTPSLRRALGAVKVLVPSDDWLPHLHRAFDGVQAGVYPRTVYRHTLQAMAPCGRPEVVPITPALMEDDALGNRGMIAGEVTQMWGGVDAFLQEGFGVCAVVDGAVAGFCTAEYVSPGRCGMGVATAPEHRRQGLAAAMTNAFLAMSARRGVTPFWDCWTNNQGSIKTATRAGFQFVADYPAFLLNFAP